MPELQEPPPLTDSDRLKSAFNSELKAANGIDPTASGDEEQTEGTPTLVPAKVKDAPKEEKVDTLIPAEFIDKKTEVVIPIDEPLVAEDVKQNLKGKARESFDKLETAAKTRIEKLQQELADARKQPVGAPAKEHEDAYKAALERSAALEQELERSAYERSPKYQRFGTEEKAELGLAKSYLEGTNVNAAIIDAATHANGPARIKIMRESGMDAETIAAVGPHLARVDALRRERDASLENWRTTMTHDMEVQKAQAAQQEARRVADEASVYEKVSAEMQKNDPAFTLVEGNSKWNARVEENKRETLEFYKGKKSLEDIARIVHLGISAGTKDIMISELTRMLNEERSASARLKAAQPNTGTGGEKKTEKVNADDPKNSSQHYRSAFNAEMAAVREGQGLKT